MLAKTMLGLAALSVAAPIPTLAFSDNGVTIEQASAEARDYRYDGRYDRRDDRRYDRRSNRYDNNRYNDNRRYRDQRVNRNTRVWNQNGRTYCKRDDGTTGLLIGGAAGAVLGAEVAGRQNTTLGAIIGAVGGGLLGRSIDRGDMVCRRN